MNSNNEEPWITMNDFVEIDDTEKNAEKKQEPEIIQKKQNQRKRNQRNRSLLKRINQVSIMIKHLKNFLKQKKCMMMHIQEQKRNI